MQSAVRKDICKDIQTLILMHARGKQKVAVQRGIHDENENSKNLKRNNVEKQKQGRVNVTELQYQIFTTVSY